MCKVDHVNQNCVQMYDFLETVNWPLTPLSGLGDCLTDYLVQRSGVSIMSHILLKA